MSTLEQVTPAVEAKLNEIGFELFEIRFFHAGSRAILRVLIDSQNGIKIDDCERVSNELSILLDGENFFDTKPYTLEISSPGIDRPLKTERDYRRITGKFVNLHLSEDIAGKKTHYGQVVQCEKEILVLKVKENTIEIPLAVIYSGKEDIRFK